MESRSPCRHDITFPFCIFSLVGSLAGILAFTPALQAQVIPDVSLPIASQVISSGEMIVIGGGTPAGSNLFHSFESFSLPTGSIAQFQNELGIRNIMARVTGGQVSTIDGVLSANSAANLFLVNPAGIVFGEHAELAIGGSFVATSAAGVEFADGLIFTSEVDAESTTATLLSVNVPIGLQMGCIGVDIGTDQAEGVSTPGSIQVLGSGNLDSTPDLTLGLTSAPGQTLVLVGGDVTIAGGSLASLGGQVALASVRSGTVGLSVTPSAVGLDVTTTTAGEFGTISLTDAASVFVPTVVEPATSGIRLIGGEIAIDGSRVVTMAIGEATAGSITIKASQSLQLGGSLAVAPFSAEIVSQVASGATGHGGKIDVVASELTIADGARLASVNLGVGQAGDVTVDVGQLAIAGFFLPEAIAANGGMVDPEQLRQTDSNDLLEHSTQSRISSENFSSGAGGAIDVAANSMAFAAGGQIMSLAGREATGDGGAIAVVASQIDGTGAMPSNPLITGGIGSYTTGAARSGDVTIAANRIALTEGSNLFSWTQGSGDSGDLTIQSQEFFASGRETTLIPLRAGILSASLGSGRSGDIEVDIDQIELTQVAQISSVVASSFFGQPVPKAGTGQAGQLTIRSDTLLMADSNSEGQVPFLGSFTFSSGAGGNVDVSARQIMLSSGSKIGSAIFNSFLLTGEFFPETGSGNTGDVTVRVSEALTIEGANPILATSASAIESLVSALET
ncbi:MAG: filamentous hemagglutinin N-terminal domain-containing protein [Coleofasciculaceae cyanobacterium RL_1_1]|nr:filamentous hemagglutinin N-terminal domain-containing protein [Coleofasciculaceae cyanobacterium RL_1_1]